ncbi:MAG: cell division protein FtsA, partial [Saprospiraceae bacterium]|nr:cell division protein FtsA [Saprospiraceae bacterium]
LTGGGALLKHIDRLTALHTGMNTRIGVPVEHLAHGYTERLSSPIFATCVGLLMKGVQDLEEGKLEARLQAIQNEHRKGAYEGGPEVEGNRWYEQLFKKTKEWFEAEPDAEF